jgi:hypothetical protein
MRLILFRALPSSPTANKQFVYGDLSQISKNEVYIVGVKEATLVLPNSVEQFINELDANKDMIFEGDLLRDAEGDIWLVRYSNKYKNFVLKMFKGHFVSELKDVDFSELVKIGNIQKIKERKK